MYMNEFRKIRSRIFEIFNHEKMHLKSRKIFDHAKELSDIKKMCFYLVKGEFCIPLTKDIFH